MTAPPTEAKWKFRKKPVEVDAWQFNDFDQPTWLGCMYDENNDVVFCPSGEQIYISTLEGVMTAKPGDWIIRGVKGEFYSCKPDIFALTYEPAASPSPPPLASEREMAIRQRLEKITPGEWTVETYDDGDSLVIHSAKDDRVCFMATPGSLGDSEKIEADADFIAHAPADISALLQALDAERAENARMREALEPFAKMHDEIEAAASLYAGPESDPNNWAKSCSWEDLQRAKAALSNTPPPLTAAALELREREVVEEIRSQKQAMEIYLRVHDELDDGKKWEEIDHGLRNEGRTISYNYWKGYMEGRFINALKSALDSLPPAAQDKQP